MRSGLLVACALIPSVCQAADGIQVSRGADATVFGNCVPSLTVENGTDETIDYLQVELVLTLADGQQRTLELQSAYREGVLDEFLAPHGEHRAGGAKLVFVKAGVRGKLYREGVQLVLDPEALESFRARILEAARLMAAASFAGPLEREFRGRPDLEKQLPRVPEVTHD